VGVAFSRRHDLSVSLTILDKHRSTTYPVDDLLIWGVTSSNCKIVLLRLISIAH